jgi:hypothetical protein
VPADTPTTVPVALTNATPGALELQLTAGVVLQSCADTLAASDVLAPTTIEVDPGLTASAVTVHGAVGHSLQDARRAIAIRASTWAVRR